MDFLKRLFGGGGGGPGGGGARDATGLYYFVKPHTCDEVIRVRIDRNNDLSLSDDGKSYFVHKHVRGTQCFRPVELELTFDSNRNLSHSEVTGGVLVDQSAYEAWQVSQQTGA